MRHLKALALVPMTLALAACNDEFVDSLPTYVPTGDEAGIYVNNDTPVVMFVDTNSNEFPVIIGDFHDSAVYATKEVVESLPTIKTKGIISGSYLGWVADDTTEFTFHLTEGQANVTGVIENTNVLYSLDKAPNAQSLAELSSGWVEQASDSRWQISESGSFSITVESVSCLISGTLLAENGYYVSGDVSVTNCTEEVYNSSFPQVRLGTFEQNNKRYAVAIFVKDDALIWQSVSQDLTVQ